MSTWKSAAISGSRPVGTNSVVPMAKALMARASRAGGMRGGPPASCVHGYRASATVAYAGYRGKPVWLCAQRRWRMAIADDAVEVRAQGWRTLAALHGRLEESLEKSLQAEFGLSVVEYTVLDTLARQDGWHMRMQQVARAAALSQSATTRLVTRLENRGLLSRYLCP